MTESRDNQTDNRIGHHRESPIKITLPMHRFTPGNELWKRRKPSQTNGNSLRVLRPVEEVNYWRKVLEMALQEKDYKALTNALEIINVIQRGKPATQLPGKSREKKDDLSGLMTEVFRPSSTKQKTENKSNQSDTEE